MKLSKIKKNPNNPRILRDDKFEKLKRSIEEFPEMMVLRPIIVDKAWTILGGNMRYEAIKALGLKEIPDDWVKRAEDLTDDQKREFVIKDNVGFGEWDWDLIANEWDDLPLSEWGLDVPGITADDDSSDTSPKLDGLAYRVIILCENEQEQAALLARFEAEGLRCQALIS